jgi:hypothetical protein
MKFAVEPVRLADGTGCRVRFTLDDQHVFLLSAAMARDVLECWLRRGEPVPAAAIEATTEAASLCDREGAGPS